MNRNKTLNDLIDDLIEMIYDCLQQEKYSEEFLDEEIDNAIMERRRVDGKYIDFESDLRAYICNGKFAYTTVEMIGKTVVKSHHAFSILDLPIVISNLKESYNEDLTKKYNKNIKIVHWGNEQSIDYAVMDINDNVPYLNEDGNLFLITDIQTFASKISDYVYNCIYNNKEINFKLFYSEISNLCKEYYISKDIFFNLLCKMLSNESIEYYEKYGLERKLINIDNYMEYEEFEQLDDIVNLHYLEMERKYEDTRFDFW